jgi:hypothetical protein
VTPMDEDFKNCTFLKRLSPELQQKIQSITDKPPLPNWPEQTRGIPNLCLRSALFGIIQRGRRKAVKREPIAAVNGLNIRYTGWRLDQGDFDVLAHSLHLAARQATGKYVQFTAKGFLKGIGRSPGKSGREWLKDSLRRLTASAVDIRLAKCRGIGPNPTPTPGRSLTNFTTPRRTRPISQVQRQTGRPLRCRLDPDAVAAAAAPENGPGQVAAWFYASHRTPYPMKVVTLQQLCGSDCRQTVRLSQQAP